MEMTEYLVALDAIPDPIPETRFTFIVNEDNPKILEPFWVRLVALAESYGMKLVGNYTPGITEEASDEQELDF